MYKHNDATHDEFTKISDFFKNVMREDKELCNEAQKNLNSGIFLNGQLHPQKEKGPLFFQKLTRDLVNKHRRQEEATGGEIWPAVPNHKVNPTIQADIDLCKTLDCSSTPASCELVW